MISRIARLKGIPKKFLEQILLEPRKQGILQSHKGKGGGYLLGKPSYEITMGQVVRMIDGPLAPLPFVSQTTYRKCTECFDERTRGIRVVMKEVRDSTARIFRRNRYVGSYRLNEKP